MLLLFVILYLAATIAIGFFASRYIHSSRDFMLAGRRLPLAISSAALFALWFGSETVFGASSEFVEHGLLGVIEDPFGGVLCLLLFALFFARPLYRMNLLTLGDLFRNRYGARAELIAAACMVLTFFGYVAAQLVAMGLLLSLIVQLPVAHCILISAAIVTAYTLAGGMWAVSITDFIQSFMIVAGLVVTAVVIVSASGGLAPLIASAPEGFFRIVPPADPIAVTEYLCAWATLGLGALASQDIFQRANSARSEEVAVRSTYLAAVLYLALSLLPLLIALAARVHSTPLTGMDPQQVLPLMVMQHTSVGVQVLFFGALLSAILSTASGAILAPASILTENIIRPLSHGRLSDRHFLLLLRLSVLLIAGISAIMAMGRQSVYELVGESYILGLVSLLVPMTAAIYWMRSSAAGAILSMTMGMATWIVFEFFVEIKIPAMVPAVAASVAGMVAGSWRNRP